MDIGLKKTDDNKLIIESTSVEHTIEIGKRVGALLQKGNILALVGELGSGKTYLTKGIAAGLNVAEYEYVSSPAFDLIHEHKGDVNVYHMDFYRIDYLSPEDYPWLEEYLYADGICIIEWADKFINDLIDSYIKIEMEYDLKNDNKRKICIKSIGEENLQRIKALVKK